MKLDRNVDRGGRGKYALVNMRKLIPVLDKSVTVTHTVEDSRIRKAFEILLEAGIITLGNETPGDQFFVMKYKDKFTAPALAAYAEAIAVEAHGIQGDPGTDTLLAELREYAAQMRDEAEAAKTLGNRIPD